MVYGIYNTAPPPSIFGSVMEVYHPSFTYILGTHAEQYAQ